MATQRPKPAVPPPPDVDRPGRSHRPSRSTAFSIDPGIQTGPARSPKRVSWPAHRNDRNATKPFPVLTFTIPGQPLVISHQTTQPPEMSITAHDRHGAVRGQAEDSCSARVKGRPHQPLAVSTTCGSLRQTELPVQHRLPGRLMRHISTSRQSNQRSTGNHQPTSTILPAWRVLRLSPPSATTRIVAISRSPPAINLIEN